jgi:hypothetical protein
MREVLQSRPVVGEVLRRHRAAVEEAVAEDRADTRLTQPRHGGVAVIGAVVAVREVEDGRHARLERVHSAEQVA